MNQPARESHTPQTPYNLFEKLFGPTIFVYSDDDAVRDGILIPFIDRDHDTGHRVTNTAWGELTTYHRTHGYPDYEDAVFQGWEESRKLMDGTCFGTF